ncbi:MAG: hypothetical protein PUE80_03275 [bacterium]|nr:hypothetical protein [bacterium]
MNKLIVVLAATLCLLTACDSIDNKALPSYTVRLDLSTTALWNTYGVSGVGDYRIFSREKRLPANFPYNANTFTGFGGVLLVMGLDAATASYAPLAFDAACPVERRADITLTIDPSTLDAVCPSCGSHYNVLNGAGGPSSGEALSQKLGLTTYKCRQNANGGYTITSY